MYDRMAIWANGNQVCLYVDCVSSADTRQRRQVMDVDEAICAVTVNLGEIKSAHNAGATVMPQCKLTQMWISLILGLLDDPNRAFSDVLRLIVEQLTLNAVGSLAVIVDVDGVTLVSSFRDTSVRTKPEGTDWRNGSALTSWTAFTGKRINVADEVIPGRDVKPNAIAVSACRWQLRAPQFAQFDCGCDEGRVIRNLHSFICGLPSVSTLHDDCLRAHVNVDATRMNTNRRDTGRGI